jgi:hypothetical protein
MGDTPRSGAVSGNETPTCDHAAEATNNKALHTRMNAGLLRKLVACIELVRCDILFIIVFMKLVNNTAGGITYSESRLSSVEAAHS